MAWERNFAAKVLKIRTKELKYQKLNYTIEASFNVRKLLAFRMLMARLPDTLECYLVI